MGEQNTSVGAGSSKAGPSVKSLRQLRARGVESSKSIADTLAQLKQDGKPIWDKLPQESTANYQRFRTYRDMAPNERARDKVAESGYVSSLSVKYAWVARAKAFDDYQRRTKVSQANMDNALQQFLTRRNFFSEMQYDLGSDMMSLARNRIDRAMGRERLPNGEIRQITPEPLKLADKDLPAFMGRAISLMSNSLELQKDIPDVAGYAPRPAGNAANVHDSTSIVSIESLEDEADDPLIALNANLNEIPTETLRQIMQRHAESQGIRNGIQ